MKSTQGASLRIPSLFLLGGLVLAAPAPAAEEAGNWTAVGGTLNEQFFSPLDRINVDTVKQLGLAWYHDLNTPRGLEAQPLVVDGVMYNILPYNAVTAYDAKTGKTLWTSAPRQATNAAILRAGDLVLALKDDAELIVARPSTSGLDPLKRYTVADSATWAQPAISGNRIFVKDVSTLALWTVN